MQSKSSHKSMLDVNTKREGEGGTNHGARNTEERTLQIRRRAVTRRKITKGSTNIRRYRILGNKLSIIISKEQ